MVLGLSLAGHWRQKGITAYNIWQCSAVASTVMFMVFVPFEALFIWNSVFYIACMSISVIYIKRVRNLTRKEEQRSLITDRSQFSSSDKQE